MSRLSRTVRALKIVLLWDPQHSDISLNIWTLLWTCRLLEWLKCNKYICNLQLQSFKCFPFLEHVPACWTAWFPGWGRPMHWLEGWFLRQRSSPTAAPELQPGEWRHAGRHCSSSEQWHYSQTDRSRHPPGQGPCLPGRWQLLSVWAQWWTVTVHLLKYCV